MRWGSNNTEVTGFGVNYTIPFAHAYRASEVLNVNPKKQIDEDVYHFARLNPDLYTIRHQPVKLIATNFIV